MQILKRYGHVMLVVPAAFLVVTFFVIPLLFLMRLSFYKYDPYGYMSHTDVLTLENYKTYLLEGWYLGTIWTTMKLSAIGTMIAVLCGYPIAYHIVRVLSLRKMKFLLITVILSFLMSFISRLYSWMAMLSSYGVINSILVYLGFKKLELIFNESGVVIGLVLYSIPFVVLTLLGPIKNIDPSLEEAAKGLGAREVRTFLKITLPLSLPGVISAGLLAYTLSISAFAIPIVLGGGKVWMMGNLIYTKFTEAPNYPLGAAVTVVCLLIALATTYLLNSYLSKKMEVK